MSEKKKYSRKTDMSFNVSNITAALFNNLGKPNQSPESDDEKFHKLVVAAHDAEFGEAATTLFMEEHADHEITKRRLFNLEQEKPSLNNE